ncbi:glyoxalase [Pseudidiomarina aestuarii]|uniref:Glyoxalase n=1 Tax=Pseudidiomarina aestuarii TaxID=624146 RepID=A0A7Z7ET87_9GAMM|nr:VOC family protein [Pseudidiomarina aestuarii]RUO40806.1 glyoxalase [Pseudidiomarina aestuarii]
MKPSISYITLGVDDLDRAVAFYRDVLGFPTDGIVGSEYESGAVAFFPMQSGLTLALWPRTSLAHDCDIEVKPRDESALMLAHNVSSREQVDHLIAELRYAGAAIKKPPRELFWGGYGAIFQDPDGHLWEIVYNPHTAN